MKSVVLRKPSELPRSASDPDPEVPVKTGRRNFTAEYKLGLLREVEDCTQPREVGKILRREGPVLVTSV